ncbi:hypothetical protein AB0I00_37510 [Streptomyces sp. NPDC050803]|uniref:hypothetical protein n=1 Tax=unclassified Streptomyces TaxID=2593676 RepID=UPI003431FA22
MQNWLEHTLTWDQVDPARHPFPWDADEERQVLLLAGEVLPVQYPGQEPREVQYRSADVLNALFVGRYGLWARHWSWGVGEGGGGGVVGSWCCPPHSVTTPEETARRAVAALVEWREWVEELAGRFEELAPPPGADAEARSWHIERAAVRLVTRVVDRTGAQCGWYGICRVTLAWFLMSTGMSTVAAWAAVEEAVGGRFASWTTPANTLVDSVGERLAVGLTGELPYRDHREHSDLEELHDRG